MFSKSARFHAQSIEAPGPGDYDPQDPHHRRTSGINFAADTIQRFAADKEQEFRLGPGYYTATPGKAPKSRRSSITSTTFVDARKRFEDSTRKPTGNEVIRELTEQLRECENSRRAECVRAEEAQSRVTAIRALYEEEVHKRNEIEQMLSTLSLQHQDHVVELKCKFETELSERTHMIESLKHQLETCEKNKIDADQQIVTLSAQIANMAEARQALMLEHETVAKQVESLEQSLQQQIEQCAQLDAQMRQGASDLERQQAELEGVLSRIAELEVVRTQLMAERQDAIGQAKDLEVNFQKQVELCKQLDLEVRECKQEAETRRSEVVALQQTQQQNEQDRQLMQTEILEKKQHINNLEAKISSTQLILSTTQETLKTSTEEVGWMSKKMSDLEEELASKEECLNKKMAEFAHLEKQLMKKKATILEQKARSDKLLEDHRLLQNQKLAAEKKSASQIEQLQNSLQTVQQQALSEATTYQSQLNQSQATIQALQNGHSERMATLLGNLSTAENRIGTLESEVLSRNEQFASLSKEAQTSQDRLTGEVNSLSCKISELVSDCEKFKKQAQDSNQSLQLAEEKLQKLQQEKTDEEHAHTEEMLELQTIIHNNQEIREQHIAKLGSYEVQVSDLLARVHTTELEATKYVAELEAYETKLNNEISKNESLMVQLANTEMALEDNKVELFTSVQLNADLRERLLAEQHLSSDLEAQHKLEITNAKDLRDSLSQNEVLIENQQSEIVNLKTSVERYQALLLQTERELSFQSNHHQQEFNAMTEDLRIQGEKNNKMIHSLDLNAYKLDVVTRESNERQEKIEMLEKTIKQLEVDMTLRFDSMVAEKDQIITNFEEMIATNDLKIVSLTEENQTLSRTMAIEKFTQIHALNVAVTNMNETQKDYTDARTKFEERGIQLVNLQEKFDVTMEELNSLRQQMKKCVENKNAAEKSYTSAINSFHDLTVKFERLEKECEFLKKENTVLHEENKADCAAQIEELSAFQAERKAQKEEFETYKTSVQDVMQQHEQMVQDMERLNQVVEENRAMVAEADALRVRVNELETSNRTLTESVAVLENEARETANQNALLAGHNNQRQKINIHEKMATENRQLKLENIRLSNALHDLRKATASSAILDAENIAPQGEQLATPQSTRKNVRKLNDSEADVVKTGPLQHSFQSWQQKKQKQSLTATEGKRTPLAPLNGVSRRLSLRTPQKFGLI